MKAQVLTIFDAKWSALLRLRPGGRRFNLMLLANFPMIGFFCFMPRHAKDNEVVICETR